MNGIQELGLPYNFAKKTVAPLKTELSKESKNQLIKLQVKLKDLEYSSWADILDAMVIDEIIYFLGQLKALGNEFIMRIFIIMLKD